MCSVGSVLVVQQETPGLGRSDIHGGCIVGVQHNLSVRKLLSILVFISAEVARQSKIPQLPWALK